MEDAALRNFAYKYISLSSMTLLGMIVALYADIKIGKFLVAEELDGVVKQITLLMAFDIVVRESLRFSLLKEFASTKDGDTRYGMYGNFFILLVIVGFVVSTIYAFVYVQVLHNITTADVLLVAFLFCLMLVSSGLQLILNLCDKYFVYSFRVFVFPVSILSWIYLFIDTPLEYVFLFTFSVYAILLFIVLRGVLKIGPLKGGVAMNIKKYFQPPLFPMTNYSFLQLSRYTERSLVGSVSSGSSYVVYLSFRIYSSFISLIGLPISVIVSKYLVDNHSKEGAVQDFLSKKFVKILSIIVSLWACALIMFYIIYEAGLLAILSPTFADNDFIRVVVLYFLSALFGSLNLPLQASIYKSGGHSSLMRLVVILNVLYLICIVFGSNYYTNIEYIYFVGFAFLCYTATEFILSLFLLYFMGKKRVPCV